MLARQISTTTHSESHDFAYKCFRELTKYSNWPYTHKRKNGESNSSSNPPTTTQAIVFGLGSMFNHSTLNQNVGWERDLQNLLITYVTLREVKEGEELCISYGPHLTFKVTDMVEEEGDPDDWTDFSGIIDLIG
jgi:hypothetical protein